jgi:MoaA/NifB/PqqE/SkfB family radical SAM enzyme
MDQTYLIPSGCRAACTFCPFPGESEWAPERDLDEVLGSLGDAPSLDRVFVLGGDLLESDRGLALLRGLRLDGVEMPPTFLYSPLVAIDRAPLLRELPFVAGLLVPFVSLESGQSPGALPAVETVRRAQALERDGLEIVPYLFVNRSSATQLTRLFELLCRKLRLRTVFLRAVQEPPFSYAVVAPALAEVSRLAARRGVTVSFREAAPPPCVVGLHDAPELFQRTLGHASPDRVQDVMGQCDGCAERRRCQWDGRDYLTRFGADGLEPITLLPERHVRELDPRHPADVMGARWYVERDEIGVACTQPWTAIEMMGVEPRQASPCNEDWLKLRPDRVGEDGLLGVWHGPMMTTLRERIAAGAKDEVCWPQCLIHTRSQHDDARDRRIYLTGSSAPFLSNLILQYQEIVAKQASITSRPTSLGFGPTFACNNRCRMCYNVPRRQAGYHAELEPAFYDGVRESFLPYLRDLLVSGPGEPLLAKPFVKFLVETEWERYPDLSIQLTSNGRLLTPELVERLYGVPFRLFLVSLNAASPETYKLVAGQDAFDRVIQNVLHLRGVLHQFRRRRPLLHLSFVLIRSNYRELGQFLELVKRLGTGLMILPMESNNDNLEEALWRDAAAYEDATRMIAKLRETHRRDAKITQYLAALARSLELQRRDPHLK